MVRMLSLRYFTNIPTISARMLTIVFLIYVCILWRVNQVGGLYEVKKESSHCKRYQALQGDSGEIISHEQIFNTPYPINLNCKWIITGRPGRIVRIQFKFFSLEPSTNCQKDYLLVYDGRENEGRLVKRLCGYNLPHDIVSKGQSLTVIFKSDYNLAAKGFMIFYDLIRMVSSKHVLIKRILMSGGGVLSSTLCTLKDKRILSNYQKIMCQWELKVSYGKMRLMFYNYNILPAANCDMESVSVYDGSSTSSHLITKFCGQKKPPLNWITSLSGSHLTVVFRKRSKSTLLKFKAIFELYPEVFENMPDQTISRPVNCIAPTPNHKKVKLGIFYTHEMLREWTAKTGEQDPMWALEILIKELNLWFSPALLGYGSKVEFSLSPVNVVRFSDSPTMKNLSEEKSDFAIIKRCCEFALTSKVLLSQNWDYAVFLLDTKSFKGMTYGRIYSMQNMCSEKQNCAFVKTSTSSVSTFYIYPVLLAHELSHAFGVHHYEDTETMMTFNRQTGDATGWHESAKRKIYEQFKDKETFLCLKWECGETSRDLFSEQSGMKILNDMCESVLPNSLIYVIRKWKIEEYLKFNDSAIKYIFKERLKENYQFYKTENVCKGIPCQLDKSIYPITQNRLTRWKVKCGMNKVCNNGACV